MDKMNITDEYASNLVNDTILFCRLLNITEEEKEPILKNLKEIGKYFNEISESIGNLSTAVNFLLTKNRLDKLSERERFD